MPTIILFMAGRSPRPTSVNNLLRAKFAAQGAPMKSVEPELLFEVDRFSQNTDAISHAVDQLYKNHHSIILESERSIEHVHREYLKLIEPITAQIYNTVAQGRPFMPDDFIGSFTQSSFWMVKTMKRISEVYEQQRRRAVLLTRMASN